MGGVGVGVGAKVGVGVGVVNIHFSSMAESAWAKISSPAKMNNNIIFSLDIILDLGLYYNINLQRLTFSFTSFMLNIDVKNLITS